MKKILVDMTFVSRNRPTYSITIYLFRFLDAIPQDKIQNYILLTNRSEAAFIRERFPQFRIRVWRRNPFVTRILKSFPKWKEHYIEFSFSLMIDYGSHNTVLMVSDMDSKTKVKLRNKKKVVVIHDLKSVEYNENPELNKQCLNFYKSYVHSSDRVIAISEYTKKEIVRLFDKKPSEIDVVYNSVVLSETSCKHTSDFPTGYILYVNTLQPYKNAITLLKAFIEIKDITTKSLVFVGRSTDYWENVLKPIIEKEKLKDRVLLFQNLSNAELKYCYENASLFVTTSLYEGFGYTPIEAAICGCPVISCECTALPEVSEGRFTYYAPAEDYMALGKKILNMPEKEKQAEYLNDLALYFADKYSAKKQYARFEEILMGN